MKETVSFSWWLDGQGRPSHQSSWLQEILSDMDEKIKTIVNIIQDDGESFTERAELFYKRTPELLKILKDLHKSYQSLAEKYDALRSLDQSTPSPGSQSRRSPFSSVRLRQIHTNSIKIEEPRVSIANSNPQERVEAIKDEEQCQSLTTKENVEEGINKLIVDMELKGKWSCDAELWKVLKPKLWKLVEDNLKQQSELIRRNDEKRETIKQLRGQINKLTEENRGLKSCISSYKVDIEESDSRICKFKGLNCLGNSPS